MQHVDLIIAARWIVPVEPDGLVLDNHAMVIHEGTIRAVLPIADAAEHYAAATHIERPHHVLIPGLVNAHTHAAMSLFRGMADDLPLAEWLERHIWPAEGRWASTEFVRDGTELAILEMLRGGTTCFNDMYFFPDIVAGLAIEHGIRASAGMIVIEHPTVWAGDTSGYFSKGLAVHDQYQDHPLIQTCFAPHAPYTVCDETLNRVRVLSDELDVPVHIHVHETAHEIEMSHDQYGCRPLERLDRLGLINPQLMAVHMTQLNDDEIRLIADRGAHVVHCPESNMKLASGLCPVAALLSAGVNVALGTDGAGSNNDLDMFGEMRTAALLAKSVAADATAVPAHQALAMATINGARALGRENETGSLVAGKQADAVCVDLNHPACQPVYQPISQLVYSATRDQVTDVWVGGRQVIDQGDAITGDECDILERASAWQKRLSNQQ